MTANRLQGPTINGDPIGWPLPSLNDIYCKGPRVGAGLGLGLTALLGPLGTIASDRTKPDGGSVSGSGVVTIPVTSLLRMSLLGTQFSFETQITSLSGVGAYAEGGIELTGVMRSEALDFGASTDSGFATAAGLGDGLGSSASIQTSEISNGLDWKIQVKGGPAGGGFIGTGEYSAYNLATNPLGC